MSAWRRARARRPALRAWLLLGASVASVAALASDARAGQAAAQAGAAVFAERCARCHGSSGKSDTEEGRALKVRPLFEDPVLARMTPRQIALAVRSNAKHNGIGVPDGVDAGELEDAAIFVKSLATAR